MAPVIEYPKILYHPSGKTIQVENAEEDARAVQEYGFLESPPSSEPSSGGGASAYVPIEYPKLVYNGKGGHRMVANEDEEAHALTQGYVEDVNGPAAPAPVAAAIEKDPVVPPPPAAVSAPKAAAKTKSVKPTQKQHKAATKKAADIIDKAAAASETTAPEGQDPPADPSSSNA